MPIEVAVTFGVCSFFIVVGVIILSLFFTFLNWFHSLGVKPEAMAVRERRKKYTPAIVHLQNSKTFHRVRFVG